MPVFVVVVKTSTETVAGEISKFPEADVYRLTDDAWLISYEGTTRALAEKIGIRGDKESHGGIAFSITNYSGRFSADVWEWLVLHMNREDA